MALAARCWDRGMGGRGGDRLRVEEGARQCGTNMIWRPLIKIQIYFGLHFSANTDTHFFSWKLFGRYEKN